MSKIGALAIDPAREVEFSASKAPRMDACAASAGRIAQVVEYMREHDVPFVEGDAATVTGDVMHQLFALVPFRSTVLGVEGVNDGKYAAKRLRALAAEHDLSFPDPDDYFLATRMLVARDSHVDAWLKTLPGPIQDFSVSLDSDRVRQEFSFEDQGGSRKVAASGLADFTLEVTDAAGDRHILILDYKTGRNSPTPVDANNRPNRQLTTLVGLWQAKASSEGRPFSSAAVSLITRDGVYNPELMPFVIYDVEQLEAAVERTALWADDYDYSRSLGLAVSEESEGELLEAMGETIGDHCRYCAGKTACRAIRETLEEKVEALREEGPKFLDEVREFTGSIMENGAGDPSEALRLLRRGQEIEQWSSLAQVVEEETAFLVRTVHARSPEDIVGVSVGSPGNSVAPPDTAQIKEIVDLLAGTMEATPKIDEMIDTLAQPAVSRVKALVADHCGRTTTQAGRLIQDKVLENPQSAPFLVNQERPKLMV